MCDVVWCGASVSVTWCGCLKNIKLLLLLRSNTGAYSSTNRHTETIML